MPAKRRLQWLGWHTRASPKRTCDKVRVVTGLPFVDADAVASLPSECATCFFGIGFGGILAGDSGKLVVRWGRTEFGIRSFGQCFIVDHQVTHTQHAQRLGVSGVLLGDEIFARSLDATQHCCSGIEFDDEIKQRLRKTLEVLFFNLGQHRGAIIIGDRFTSCGNDLCRCLGTNQRGE